MPFPTASRIRSATTRDAASQEFCEWMCQSEVMFIGFLSLRFCQEVAHVSPLAVAEVIWTLERFYRLSKSEVVARVSPLLKLKGLRVAGKEVFLKSLTLYAEKTISFTDAYIAVQMERAGSEEIYSYDKDFDRLEEVVRIEP